MKIWKVTRMGVVKKGIHTFNNADNNTIDLTCLFISGRKAIPSFISCKFYVQEGYLKETALYWRSLSDEQNLWAETVYHLQHDLWNLRGLFLSKLRTTKVSGKNLELQQSSKW